MASRDKINKVVVPAIAGDWEDGGVSDILERAENWLRTWGRLGSWPVVRDLMDELRAAPDRTFVDDQGRRWEWCGGQPGTWAWRITGSDGPA